MIRKAAHKNNFSEALKVTRVARGISQDSFSLVSSRTYVSTLERGLKSPTLIKVDALAEVLEIHPLTLLTLAYVDQSNAEVLLNEVLNELQILLDRQQPT